MTEYDKLKRVVVGRECLIKTRLVDFTLKHFFRENLLDQFYAEDFVSYELTDEVIQERVDDLDNFASLLTDEGIQVKRPKIHHGIKHVKLPYFNSIFASNSNVRDLTFTYDNFVIATPPSIRSRYLEHLLLQDIIQDEFQTYGKTVISHPPVTLLREKMDLSPWKQERRYTRDCIKMYETLFDAANCIKATSKDIIFNVNNYNNYNGYLWLKTIMPSSVNVHMVSITDNHIDGTILPVREGAFLVNSCFLQKDIRDLLPVKFRSWDIIEPTQEKLHPGIYDQGQLTAPQLATVNGIDINVLSLDHNKVCVQDDAVYVMDALHKRGFDVIPVQLRHSVLFGGGLHCSTLDLERGI